jgi:voltage-gated potassium channel
MTALYRLRLSLALLAVVVASGTLGYVTIEHYPFLDAVYMTVITLTTVGFGEIHPLSPWGRGFTIGLIAFGLGTVYAVIGNTIDWLFGEQLREAAGRQRMERRLHEIKDHSIICGYGRMGQEIARELQMRGRPYVVIERDPQEGQALEAAGIPHVIGDASHDEVLLKAGVERARHLIAVAPTDADNIFITLSGRSLNPRLNIVARSAREEDEHKLRRAGADRVISPYVIGARRIAAAVYRPDVIDFLDIHAHGAERELELDCVPIGPSAPFAGRSLRDSCVREKTGCTILALRCAEDGRFVNNPGPDTILRPGDRMIVLGTIPQLDALQRLSS